MNRQHIGAEINIEWDFQQSTTRKIWNRDGATRFLLSCCGRFCLVLVVRGSCPVEWYRCSQQDLRPSVATPVSHTCYQSRKSFLRPQSQVAIPFPLSFSDRTRIGTVKQTISWSLPLRDSIEKTLYCQLSSKNEANASSFLCSCVFILNGFLLITPLLTSRPEIVATPRPNSYTREDVGRSFQS